MIPCKVLDCTRLAVANGFCGAHYRRLRIKGDVQADIPIRERLTRERDVCSVVDCERLVLAKGMCSPHYYRWKTTGTAAPERRLRGTKTNCRVLGCDRPSYCLNVCRTHYSRLRSGDLKEDVAIGLHPPTECTVPGCLRTEYVRGWCAGHYYRWKTCGDVQAAKPLRRLRRLKGTPRIKEGYVYINSRAEHRLVMEQVLGRPLLSNENVHHKNTIRADNNPSNLELWNVSQPKGGRVRDKLAWALEFVAKYMPDVLTDVPALVAQAEVMYP